MSSRSHAPTQFPPPPPSQPEPLDAPAAVVAARRRDLVVRRVLQHRLVRLERAAPLLRDLVRVAEVVPRGHVAGLQRDGALVLGDRGVVLFVVALGLFCVCVRCGVC